MVEITAQYDIFSDQETRSLSGSRSARSYGTWKEIKRMDINITEKKLTNTNNTQYHKSTGYVLTALCPETPASTTNPRPS